MADLTPAEVRSLVADILTELSGAGMPTPSAPPPRIPTPSVPTPSVPTPAGAGTPAAAPTAAAAQALMAGASPRPPNGPTPRVEVADPTADRHTLGVLDPANPTGLTNLAASTGARIGVGRAGSRPRTFRKASHTGASTEHTVRIWDLVRTIPKATVVVGATDWLSV